MSKTPCLPGCTCGLHFKSRCPPGCTCGLHSRQQCPPDCTCGLHTKRQCPPTCDCGRHTCSTAGRGRPKLEQEIRTRPPTLIAIGWAAGLYEGEGSCSTTGKANTLVNVVQKDDFILYKLQELFGGKVATYPQGSIWSCRRERAWGFLFTIFTLLSPRRRQQIKDVYLDELSQANDVPELVRHLIAERLYLSRLQTTSKGPKRSGLGDSDDRSLA
jgi:hypothetical protein